MTHRRSLPPAEYLRACFSYDPETGALTWGAQRESRPAQAEVIFKFPRET
jgi:hypothetical protein